MSFIAAMDHSGGSTGGVLDRYGQEYTEENKMEKVHAMRLRMVNSPDFVKENIWASILYVDTVERGMVTVLQEKGIQAFLKVDSGCEEDGSLKDFDLQLMIDTALFNKCSGTKMRSIVKSIDTMDKILDQQFDLAQRIYDAGLMPIIEPEIPIDHPDKASYENMLGDEIEERLEDYDGECILKLTLPERPNIYSDVMRADGVKKVVGLSGGYSTEEACDRLSKQRGMTASFSRALSEGLFANQTDEEFNQAISKNINMIRDAGNA